MRVVALAKQIPQFEVMRLRADGRLDREGLPLEMSAYCRRAVAQGVALAAATDGTCTVMTMGPPSAEDVLHEAITFGADDGVLVSDPALAGSDTLVTARALAAAIARLGPVDVVLVGRASLDADTGQVGPQLAQLLDLPFATGVKRLVIHDDGRAADVGLELDDEWVDATVELPAVLGVAERLIDPCKIKDPSAWDEIDPSRIRHLSVDDLGEGPWGEAGSPTHVGRVRTEQVDRAGIMLDGPVTAQVDKLIAYLRDRGALGPPPDDVEPLDRVPPSKPLAGPAVAVLVEPGRPGLARELLGEAAGLASRIDGHVMAVAETPIDPHQLDSWGADAVVSLRGGQGVDSRLAAEDVADALLPWVREEQPWAMLAGSTAWGREVASRVAAACGAGLVGDAVGLSVEDGRLVGWKPAFGGSLVAAITCSSPLQLVTVRAGVLSELAPRPPAAEHTSWLLETARHGRITVKARRREDDESVLSGADAIIGVGQGVDPAEYHLLTPLRSLLGAELGATRKVTDQGSMPHARQIGITGHAVAPRLYVALGTSGKYNHMVGVRSAGTVVGVNTDPEAPLWAFTDIGLLADWHEVVPELVRQLGPDEGSVAS